MEIESKKPIATDSIFRLEWVVRSYVVTFTFVTFRWLAELGILQSLEREAAATLVWLSWSMPLLATEVILQGRKVIARRGAV
jgi:hypothetical protein